MGMKALASGRIEVGTIADENDRSPRIKLVGHVCKPWEIHEQGELYCTAYSKAS